MTLFTPFHIRITGRVKRSIWISDPLSRFSGSRSCYLSGDLAKIADKYAPAATRARRAVEVLARLLNTS